MYQYIQIHLLIHTDTGIDTVITVYSYCVAAGGRAAEPVTMKGGAPTPLIRTPRGRWRGNGLGAGGGRWAGPPLPVDDRVEEN